MLNKSACIQLRKAIFQQDLLSLFEKTFSQEPYCKQCLCPSEEGSCLEQERVLIMIFLIWISQFVGGLTQCKIPKSFK